MLQRVASMVRSFFFTNEVVPPPPAPITIMGMGCMSPVPVDPLTEMDQTVRGFASEGFKQIDTAPDGGVIMESDDGRVQVSIHPDGRITTYLSRNSIH